MNEAAPQRFWSFPRFVFRELTQLLMTAWLGFTIAIIGIALSIHQWGTLDQSIWEKATQAGHWFIFVMGIQIGMVYLPMNITHGKTRRDTAIETGLFIGAFSAITAVLLTAGWVIERVLFRILDVEQRLTENHLFDAATDYPLIFLESWVSLALWAAGGLFIAAAYYRYEGAGLLAIIPALIVASMAGIFLDSTWGPAGRIADSAIGLRNPPILVSLLACVAGVGILLGMAWLIIRDLPIRKLSA